MTPALPRDHPGAVVAVPQAKTANQARDWLRGIKRVRAAAVGLVSALCAGALASCGGWSQLPERTSLTFATSACCPSFHTPCAGCAATIRHKRSGKRRMPACGDERRPRRLPSRPRRAARPLAAAAVVVAVTAQTVPRETQTRPRGGRPRRQRKQNERSSTVRCVRSGCAGRRRVRHCRPWCNQAPHGPTVVVRPCPPVSACAVTWPHVIGRQQCVQWGRE